MQIFENSAHLPEAYQDAVIVIGNFDGLHKGHQELIATARSIAIDQNRPLGVLSFCPHPRRFFKPDTTPFQLASSSQKQRLFADQGVDFIIKDNFDETYSQQSARDFVSEVLVNRCHARHVLVGYNFHFGKNRSGTPGDLKDFGAQFGFNVTVIDKVEPKTGAGHYSSTGFREMISDGKLPQAAEALGWWWEIDGPVLHGDQRGRELGYPTANQALGDYIRPLYGIYAVRASLENNVLVPDQWLHGVANLGIRPMFEVKAPLLETFIFDFDQDIYGQSLRVQLIERIRGEEKFDSLDALITQMDADKIKAQEILTSRFGAFTKE
jgi:riboflavin kinase/FMN adenylyltransferase